MPLQGAHFIGVADREGHCGQRLADLDRRLVAGGMAQRGQAHDQLHLAVQCFVYAGGIGLGPVRQVDRFGSRRVSRAHQVLVQFFGDEGHGGGEQLAQRDQGLVQGGVGGLLVEVGLALPEAAARAAQVPLRQVVDESLDGAGGAGHVVGVEGPGDVAHQGVQFGEQPAVEVGVCRLAFDLVRGPLIQVGVGDEERIDVPQGEGEITHHFTHQVDRETPFLAGRAGGVQVPAESIGAVGMEHVPGIDHIAAALGHLLPFGVQDQAKANDVLEGHFLEEHGSDGVQRVEPAAGLVHRLANEVGRELFLEGLLVLEGVVPLGHRHGARVEPHVDQFGDAGHATLALRAGEVDLVYEGAVQVEPAQVLARALGKLLHRADRQLVAAGFTFPHGQRGAPVALAAQGPVDVILQPVAEAPVFDVLGHPVDLLVEGYHLIFVLAGADIPGAAGVVQQGRVAAPAEGVGVGDRPGGEEQAAGGQILDDQRVGVFDEPAGPGADLGDELAVVVNGHDHRQVIFQGGGHILGAEGRGGVHQAGAVLGGHVILEDDVIRRFVGVDEGEQRLVAFAFELLPFVRVDDGVGLVAEDLLQQGAGQDQALGAALFRRALHGHVLHLRMGGDGHIAGQRPGRGGPHQQRGAGLVDQRHAHEDRRVHRLPVPQGDLVVGEGRAAARAVGHDLVALVEQALIPQRFQNPPHRLDVGVGVGDVGLFQVDPEAEAVGEFLPLLDVLESRLAAELVEGSDAVGLDLALIGEAELLLHADFHR